ncbi:MAG: fasciclin domain-containing protein [Bacteroidales bacterium]|nr:fasciclin domain-containing protein [Bacteroidales bacterium]
MKLEGKANLRSMFLKSVPAAALLLIGASSCSDDFDSYYERPSWLEKPASEVLSSRDDCEQYMKLVEKTLYSKQLQGSGSYTFFVPTDEAFEEFFNENEYGWRSVDDIPEEEAANIVSYLMLYNQYVCDSLGNYHPTTSEHPEGSALKHQTPSYQVLSRESYNGDSIYAYDYPGAWTETWHNYRYLPTIADSYRRSNLSESDYSKVFPGRTFSAYGNVVDAQILASSNGSADLYCENGVVHLINKVVLPLKNLDDMISDYPEASSIPASAQNGSWSTLKKILNHRMGSGEYQFLSYEESTAATHYFEKMYPEQNLDNLQMRMYKTSTNPFALNLEAYTGSVDGDDTYNSGVTFFVPTESKLKDYIENRVLSYVDHSGWDASQASFDRAFNQVAENVLPTLWGDLQANGIIWPSHFATAHNSLGYNEFIDSNDSTKFNYNNVLSSGFASNGMYHIIDYVPQTGAFEGVGSRFVLDPKYGVANLTYSETYANSMYNHMLYSRLSGYPQVNFTLILNSDKNLEDWSGVNYNSANSAYSDRYDATVSTSSTTANTAINEMAQRSFIERDATDALDLSTDVMNGAYGGWGFTTNYFGDVLRYKKIDGTDKIMVQSIWSILNDPTEAPLWNTADNSAVPAGMQASAPTPDYYTTVVEDEYAGYVNGKVYRVEEGSVPLSYGAIAGTYNGINGKSYLDDDYYGIQSYLEWYLRCDSARYAQNPSLPANMRHTLFKEYWDFAYNRGTYTNALARWRNVSPATTLPEFGTNRYTILVPTDEALQVAIDKGYLKTCNEMATLNRSNRNLNYRDTICAFLKAYLTVTDTYPDDGAAYFYSTNTWDCPSVNLVNEYQIGTSYQPVSDDYEDFMSGTQRLYIRVSKTGDNHNLRFLGRDYETGQYTAYRAINAADEATEEHPFDNQVVRGLGQSNIICRRGIIHSLNGYIFYKFVSKESQQ